MSEIYTIDWIVVEDSNFASPGMSVHFSNPRFVCSKGPEAGLKIDAGDIVFLNKPPQSRRISSATDTNVFRTAFKIGAQFAIIAEFFGFASAAKDKKKRTQKIIAKFKDNRFLIGKTDRDTFFAIQNAWLDRR